VVTVPLSDKPKAQARLRQRAVTHTKRCMLREEQRESYHLDYLCSRDQFFASTKSISLKTRGLSYNRAAADIYKNTLAITELRLFLLNKITAI